MQTCVVSIPKTWNRTGSANFQQHHPAVNMALRASDLTVCPEGQRLPLASLGDREPWVWELARQRSPATSQLSAPSQGAALLVFPASGTRFGQHLKDSRVRKHARQRGSPSPLHLGPVFSWLPSFHGGLAAPARQHSHRVRTH